MFFDHRWTSTVHLSACKIAPGPKAFHKLAHLFSPRTLKGDSAPHQALRCLRQGRLQSVSDCRGFRPSKQKPPSGSAALLFVRPAAGTPRRLRQRYAVCLVDRYAPDRAAVVVVGRVCVIARAVFTYHRAITAVSSLYNLYVIVYGLQCLL